MGQLRQLIAELREDYLRIKGIYMRDKQLSRMLVRKWINKYDLSRAEQFVPWVTGTNTKRRPTPTQAEYELRKENPGKFDVVFINHHTKEKQILSRKDGMPYDVAELYYNYVTFFGDEKYNEFGKYEIVEHEEAHIPKEPHFGI